MNSAAKANSVTRLYVFATLEGITTRAHLRIISRAIRSNVFCSDKTFGHCYVFLCYFNGSVSRFHTDGGPKNKSSL